MIDFTVPVHTEVFGVLTTEGKPFKHWKELDNENVTLVQVRGTTPIKFIEDNLKKAKVTLLDNYPDAVRALAQGRGDAMVDVIDFVGEHMNKHQVKWKIVETPVDVYYCGLGVAKNSTGLKDWLNVAIFELHRTGKTDELWKKWFGIDMLYPTGSARLSEPCRARRPAPQRQRRWTRPSSSTTMAYTLQFGQIWPYLPTPDRRRVAQPADRRSWPSAADC